MASVQQISKDWQAAIFTSILSGFLPSLPGQTVTVSPQEPPAKIAKENQNTIFVNGLLNSLPDAVRGAQQAADVLARPVQLVYNDTLGVDRFLAELQQKLPADLKGNVSALIVQKGAKFVQLTNDLARAGICKLNLDTCRNVESAVDSLLGEVKAGLANPGRVVDLHLHSQGAILGHAMLVRLRNEPGFKDMTNEQWASFAKEHLRVTTYGAANHIWNIPNVREFRFGMDAVAVGTDLFDREGTKRHILMDAVAGDARLGSALPDSLPAGLYPPAILVALSSPPQHSFEQYLKQLPAFEAGAILAGAKGDAKAVVANLQVLAKSGRLTPAQLRDTLIEACINPASGKIDKLTLAQELKQAATSGVLREFELTPREHAVLDAFCMVRPEELICVAEPPPQGEISDNQQQADKLKENRDELKQLYNEMDRLNNEASSRMRSADSQFRSEKQREASDSERVASEDRREAMAWIEKRDAENRENTRQNAEQDQRMLNETFEQLQGPSGFDRMEEQMDQDSELIGRSQKSSIRDKLAQARARAEAADREDRAIVVNIAAVVASVFGTPAAGAAVKVAGDVMVDGKLSPGTVIGVAIDVIGSTGDSKQKTAPAASPQPGESGSGGLAKTLEPPTEYGHATKVSPESSSAGPGWQVPKEIANRLVDIACNGGPPLSKGEAKELSWELFQRAQQSNPHLQSLIPDGFTQDQLWSLLSRSSTLGTAADTMIRYEMEQQVWNIATQCVPGPSIRLP